MKAVVIAAPGGLDALEYRDVPDPLPGPDDLLVRVRAAALNRADILQRMGGYPQPGPKPEYEIPGLEYAGEVVRAGERVEGFAEGDRVMGLLPGGGYAELVTTPARLAMKVPEALSWQEAGATPEVYITAHDALLQCNLVAGERVLVHAAGSGVGVAAIQIAKAMGASLVVGTAGSAEKLARAQALGLDVGVNYREADFADAVLEATGGAGVDVVLDVIGADYWAGNMKALALNGRLVLVGLMGGATAQANLGALLMKRLQVRGTTLRARPLEQKALATRAFEKSVLPHIAAGRISVPVDAVYPLRDAAAAQERMEANLNFGKIVLEAVGGRLARGPLAVGRRRRMDARWPGIARRIVEAAGVEPGELVQIRGEAEADVLTEILLAIEVAGATPVVEFVPASSLERLWREAPLEYLAAWDRHRAPALERYDRVVRLLGADPDSSGASAAAVAAWSEAVARLTAVQDELRLPFVMVAMPSTAKASQLGTSREALEAAVLPALLTPPDELQAEVASTAAKLGTANRLTVTSGDGLVLELDRGDRPWLDDDGHMQPGDRERGTYVRNLPAGAVYTTVLEESAKGRLALPVAGPARRRDTHLRAGAHRQDPSSGRRGRAGRLARRSLRRAPAHQPHRDRPQPASSRHQPAGRSSTSTRRAPIFVALGENRYLGGRNASSLNADFIVPGAALDADGRSIVRGGRLA